jgi:hypothetical protein
LHTPFLPTIHFFNYTSLWKRHPNNNKAINLPAILIKVKRNVNFFWYDLIYRIFFRSDETTQQSADTTPNDYPPAINNVSSGEAINPKPPPICGAVRSVTQE